MTKEEIDIQKEIEEYFTESTGFGRDKIRNFMDIVNKALKQKGERIEELEKENEELKSIAEFQQSSNMKRHFEIQKLEKEKQDLRDNYDQFKAIAEPEIERLKKENAELKEHIKADCIDCADYIKNQKLKKENADLKTDKQYWEQKGNRLITEWRETLDQLTKAKEILRSLYFIIQSRIDYKNNIGIADEMWRAEQFLKGENIILEDAQAGNSPFDADKVFNKEMKAYPDEN